MPGDSWIVRRLRSRALPQAGAGTGQPVVTRAAVRRGRPGPDGDGAPARRLVVCGDDPLALRLVEELVSRYSAEVVVILPNRRANHGPQIARLPRVRVVESAKLDVETFRQARLAQADALALVKQDDVGNIHAALQAQEVNPHLRLVLRMFNMSLGYGIRRMFADCAVLSDASMAAPAFVAAALGEVAPTHVRLLGRTLFVARRTEVAPGDVLCGLARTAAGTGQPEILPSDPGRADLVLAVANGGARAGGAAAALSATAALSGAALAPTTPGGEAAAVGEAAGAGAADARGAAGPKGAAGPSGKSRRYRWPWRGRHPLATLRTFVDPKLRITVLTLIGLLVAGTGALAGLQHKLSLGDAAYLTVLTALGGVDPDLTASVPVKILQTLTALLSIALIPVVTAAVVDAVVHARLALTYGRLRSPIADHVVVVGLGNVGTRVIHQLRTLGVPVVAVDRSETAPGSAVAKRYGIPLIVGDASREETLRAASVQTSRALVCLSTDDVVNLEAALHGQGMREGLRVVLRLFDGDFADRVQRAFGIASSRSVSYLAAPQFAAVLVERQVVGTIPIGRRVLLIAEATVCAGSPLDGGTVAAANEVGRATVIALTAATGHSRDTLWSPPESHVLSAGDRLTVVATRGGLARMTAVAGDPLARPAG